MEACNPLDDALEMTMKFRGTIATAVAIVAVTALALTGCTGGKGAASSGGQLTIAELAVPTSFDPSQAQEGFSMPYYQAVYDTLILRAPNGDLKPMLATKWSYNRDNTVLTLTLRSDVKFADGTPVNPAAVKANLENFQKGGGPQAATLAALKTVDTGTDTVTLNLSSPDPQLLISLSNAAGLIGNPKELGTPAMKTTPDGSGPYTLDPSATQTGSRYTFKKNPKYWNPSLQKYGTIVIKVITDPTATFNALRSGQVDVATINAKNVAQAKAAGLVPHVQAPDWQGLIFFDRAGKTTPAIGDVRVRQAISHAIDAKKILAKVYDGTGEPTSQIFSPSSTAFEKSLEGSYDYDPAKAKQLLSEAGLTSFTVNLPVPAAVVDPALLAILTDELKAVGITVNVVQIPAADFIAQITSGKYALTWFQLFQPSAWATVQQAVAPDALYNPQHSTDPVIAKAIETMRTGGDSEEAAQAAKTLNEFLVKQAWFDPWFRADQSYFSNKKVDVQLQVQQSIPSIYNYSPAK
ncbi:peptide/nickel transport system substrate-binding protein [Leifsonia sp. CL147]|nr:peptide/nickel transport system substrate-binding protein [Leifsonia sp. CL154]SFM04152.1 peptide/nickel transport system substrate-binding protein [Leifsonia sp. CL147]